MINNTGILESHTVYLRTIEREDVTNGQWHHWYNDYNLTKNNSHGVYPINTEQELEYYETTLKDPSNISLAVSGKNDEKGTAIGTVSLTNIDLLNRKAEVACTIGKNISQTAGIEAIGLIIEHGFNRLNLNKIYGGAHQDLVEWVSMLEVLGFKKEGLLRQEFVRNGNFYDMIKFSVLSETYNSLRIERGESFLFLTSGELYKNAIKFLKASR